MEVNSSFILVISDSHGGIAPLAAALKWARSPSCAYTFDKAVFLGDGFNDLTDACERAGVSVHWEAVQGNVDYPSSAYDKKILDIPAKNSAFPSRKLFLSHGNRYRVKEEYKTIAVIARNMGAEAALFGHTHIPYCKTVDGIFLLNPGSIACPRSRLGCTFAVLECPDSGPLRARFFDPVDPGKEIKVNA